MLDRIRNYLLFAALGWGVYFLLSNHFIFYSWRDFELLPKHELTLSNTFFSLGQSDPEDVLRVPALRDDGIADLMLARGMVTQERLQQILGRIDSSQ